MTVQALPIVWHPDYLAPLRPGHRFPMSKYGYLRAALLSTNSLPGGFEIVLNGAGQAATDTPNS